MDRIKRRQFTGSRLCFFILCVTGIGIPLAVLYLIEATIEIECEIDDAETFLADYLKKKP